jgi:D-aspartate ligase
VPTDARPRAVVVGLDCITGLQTARILARRGVPVVGVAKDRRHFCCRTRASAETLELNTASDELIEGLERLGGRLDQRAVLVPCTDSSVLLISRHRERLSPWYHVVLPEADAVEMLMDKGRFYRYALEQGLPIPRTYFLGDRGDAERAVAELRFPCTLKPTLKTAEWERNAGVKAFKARSPEELLAYYDASSAWAEQMIVQEWVEGGESSLFSCNCYFDRGSRPLVTFVARKIRQWPPQTGTSSLGVECRNDVVLRETIRLFENVRFHGLGYVEMKRDERTGEHFIIEPNVGRPTGRSAIAEAGGVELLYAAYCDVAGLPLPDSLVQRYTGAKWIYWRGDLPAAFIAWRRGELTLREWGRSLRGRKSDAVFSWTEPLPFLLDLWGAAGDLTRHEGRGRLERHLPAAVDRDRTSAAAPE